MWTNSFQCFHVELLCSLPPLLHQPDTHMESLKLLVHCSNITKLLCPKKPHIRNKRVKAPPWILITIGQPLTSISDSVTLIIINKRALQFFLSFKMSIERNQGHFFLDSRGVLKQHSSNQYGSFPKKKTLAGRHFPFFTNAIGLTCNSTKYGDLLLYLYTNMLLVKIKKINLCKQI